MFQGAHVIIYSKDAEADRAFFSETLGFRHVDAGHGWLIFALPPAEIAFHPSETGGKHQLSLMCADIQSLVSEMKKKGVECSEIANQSWGSVASITLPSGTELGIYEPRHASPLEGVGPATRVARDSEPD